MRNAATATIVALLASMGPRPAVAGQELPSAPEDETLHRAKAEAVGHFVVQQAIREDVAYQTAAASTAICYFAELRNEIKKEIATEQRYAAEGGGVINMTKMYELQRKMRYLDEATGTLRSALEDRSAKPLPCSSAIVQKAALCIGWRVMDTFPSGSPTDAVERFCASDEMRALFDLVELGDKAPYWKGADQAIINISYELDRAYLVARSAEACMGEKYSGVIESKLKESKPAERNTAERFLLMTRKSREELEQAGLEPLPCDDRDVRQLLTCVTEKGDDVGVKQGCRSAELKAAMRRLQRE